MVESQPSLKPVILSILAAYWRDARWVTLLVVGASIVGALCAIAAPVLFARAVDALAAGGEPEAILATLLVYALVFALAAAVGDAARCLLVLCGQRLSFISNVAFFSRLLRKTAGFFLERNQVEIGNARREGSYALDLVLQFGVGGVLPGLVQIAFSLVVLGGLVSWETALIVLVYGGVVVGLDFWRVAKVNPSIDAAIAGSQENARLVGNAVAVIETLRQTRGEAWMQEPFLGGARGILSSWRRYALVSGGFAAAGGLAVGLQLAVTFLILLPRHEAGTITVGEIVLFNTLLLQLNQPFQLVGQAIKETADALARFRPFAAMWNAPEEPEPADPLFFPPGAGTLAFEDVGFRYPNGRGVSDLSFTVERGRPAFLVGETGSGKSTALRLLLKSAEPHAGRILAGGTDVTRIRREDWFAHVGVVPQDVALLNDSLAVNIVLGRPHDEARLRRAAERASILSRVEAMPEGFETIVGERGLKLSGGERQRIAIARALYGEPTILLLDEASSALDEETEAEIMDGLRALAGSLSILAVTHRRSIIRPGDQVIRLSEGALA